MHSELRDLRIQAGLSQPALARLSGVRQAAISEIERGLIDPRLSTVTRLKSAIDKHNLARVSDGSVPAACEVRDAGFLQEKADE